MSKLTEALEIKYKAVLESDSDSLFYQNIHKYIDFIIKTPKLSNLIGESKKEYEKKFKKIWSTKKTTDKEINYQSELVRQLERYSLFAGHYFLLFKRIYKPLEEYKNSKEDPKIDPIALLLIDGFNKTKQTDIWSEKILETYNSWFNNKRKYYENHLQQFHINLLEETKDKKSFIPLSLNPRTGDFIFYNTFGTISPSTQEFKILNLLLNSKDYQAYYLSLYQTINSSIKTIQKPHKETISQIIRNLKERFQILPKHKTSNCDIFKNVPRVGYRLVFKDPKENTE